MRVTHNLALIHRAIEATNAIVTTRFDPRAERQLDDVNEMINALNLKLQAAADALTEEAP